MASIALLVGSLSSVAVPRLSGQLIDIAIDYSKSGDKSAANARANGRAPDVVTLHLAVFIRSEFVRNCFTSYNLLNCRVSLKRRSTVSSADHFGGGWSGVWYPGLAFRQRCHSGDGMLARKAVHVPDGARNG